MIINESSPVYDIAKITPLSKAGKISKKLGFNIYLKREDLQPVHSFKLRGAYNKIISLSETERLKGVIAASAGNHAQGVAMSAQKLGLKCLIIMPKNAPNIKVEAVKSWGADVELYGDNFSEAYEYCIKRVAETGMNFIHPFDDPLVIAGQGTIANEILQKLPTTTHIFIPVGGGGLLAGIARSAKTINPKVKIIGVEPEDSAAMHRSLSSNKRIILPHVGVFADGVAVKQVGENTFKLCREYVDEVITVSTDQICAGIKSIFEETRAIVEPAGSLGITGINKYAEHHDLTDCNVVAICSGANMTFERLNFIAERTLVGQGTEALFAISLPERPGALLEFCQKVINGHTITEFNYRLNHRGDAINFVGIGSLTKDSKVKLLNKMDASKYKYTELTDDEVSQQHLRHMIGGKSNLVKNEQIYTIDFPERPGALIEFLQKISSKHINISLLHYRGQGGDTGKVLIGLEGVPGEVSSLLKSTNYDYQPAPSTVNLFL